MKPEEIQEAANFSCNLGAFMMAAGVIGVSACLNSWLFFWSSILACGLFTFYAGIKGAGIAAQESIKSQREGAKASA